MALCSFDGCGRPRRTTNQPLCEAHYYQQRRGQELRPLTPRVGSDPRCQIEGCDKPRARSRYCSMHRARIKRNGDPHLVVAPEDRVKLLGPSNHRWVVNPDYTQMHQRLRQQRGPAKNHPCPCGKSASQWAYVGPRQPGERQPYSTNIQDYVPMCAPCHKRMDLASIAQSREED